MTVPRSLLAEFIGTFTLIFAGCGAVVASVGVDSIGLVGIALAFGIAVAAMVAATGHISGAHINPAVTLSLLVAGKMKAGKAGAYVLVQLAGAAAAALALRLLLPPSSWEPVNLGATALAPQISPIAGVAIEAILTFFLVFAIFGTAVDKRGPGVPIAAFAIGLVVAMDIIVGGSFTGGSMNPARSFGPALASGTWGDWWVYLVGPLVGGAIACLIYSKVFLREPT